jgi:uncharacterized SAM-binding protein YcdF (DUF218 family)
MLLLLGLTVPPLDVLEAQPLAPLAVFAVGALLGGTRLRWLPWAITGVLSVLLLAVVSTPLTRYGLRAVLEEDPLVRADAVVVLTGGIRPSGEPGNDTEQRLLQAYELLHEGFAPRLVVTRLEAPLPSHRGVVERHMRHMGLQYPVEETPRQAHNTHGEALAVAELVRERHWSRILLVTQPTHCRRAAAVFRKAGVTVNAIPCLERRYNVHNPQSPSERLSAFADLMRELIGYQAYRMRGWI